MSVEAFGIFSLGVFIGYLTWFFVRRLASFTTEALTAIVGVVVGGLVVNFLDDNVGDESGIWWYPIGLLVGFVIYSLLQWLSSRTFPTVASLSSQHQGQAQTQSQSQTQRQG